MTKLKVAKKIAPTTSALNTTPSLLPVASNQEEPESFYRDVKYYPEEFAVEFFDAKARKSRSCVLAMMNAGTKPSCTCEHCGQESAGDVIWEGTLWDAACAMNMPDDQPFVSVTLECLYGDRAGIVETLKDFAKKTGYEYFEIRDYATSQDDYKPVCSGLLAA